MNEKTLFALELFEERLTSLFAPSTPRCECIYAGFIPTVGKKSSESIRIKYEYNMKLRKTTNRIVYFRRWSGSSYAGNLCKFW